MTSRNTAPWSWMPAVLASAVVGVLARAALPLIASATGGTATVTDVLNYALGGLIVGAGVALLSVEIARVRRRLSVVLPAALVTSPILTVGIALWMNRSDPWSGEPLYFYGMETLIGLFLGCMVAFTVRFVLGRSVQVEPHS